MICYINVHWHIGSYIRLPWYLVPTWSLGECRGVANFQDRPGAVSEWKPWPSSQSCPGAGEAMSESAPSLSDSSLQALSEPFSCLKSLRSVLADHALEPDGFKFQFHHLPALWGQERSEFLCASVWSSVNPFTGFLWELNEMGHANT